MAEYRLYALDADGNLGLPDLINAISDEEAVAKARELKPNMRRCELWKGRRLVAALNHEESSAA